MTEGTDSTVDIYQEEVLIQDFESVERAHCHPKITARVLDGGETVAIRKEPGIGKEQVYYIPKDAFLEVADLVE